MSSISEESPLAEQLKNAVQAKVLEAGWTQDDDDTSLAEYIVLMVANGKTQEQIAAELSGELLQDAQGTAEFAQWLTEQVSLLTGGANKEDTAQEDTVQEDAPIPAAYDNDLGDAAPDNAFVTDLPVSNQMLTEISPRGPRNSQSGARGGRGGRGAAQGRGGFDSALHRTRGNDRINSHVRGAPKGPKNIQTKDVRPGMQKALNGMGQNQQMQNQMMQANQQGGNFPSMSAQQQMDFMAMMEQQARMFAQFMPNMAAGGMNGNMPPNGSPNGRSMFDRVDRGRGGARGRGRGANAQNGANRKPSAEGDAESQADSAMDTESTAAASKQDPSQTVCYFNLRCTNENCPYVHQSPSAPPGIEIDMSNECAFGVACKNSKCNGKHPSPAKLRAFKAEQTCKFWPQCFKPDCPFKHPSMPVCQFGASCTNKDCKFTHLTQKCKFNPCKNPKCPYQHDEGQNKGFAGFQWTKDSANQEQESGAEHVSDRKFVVEGEEELIKPENEGVEEDSVGGQTGQQTAEVTT